MAKPQRLPKAKSPKVQKILDNEARFDKLAAEMPGSTIDGWVGFDIGSDGKVMAGKYDHGMHVVEGFEPVGLWAKEAESLRIELEQRALLFSLTDEEGKEYDRLRKLVNQQ